MTERLLKTEWDEAYEMGKHDCVATHSEVYRAAIRECLAVVESRSGDWRASDALRNLLGDDE